MQTLNIPAFPIKITQRGGQNMVFDVFRKRHVVLTPEEWVRQHFLWWLKEEKGYPASLILVESSLRFNGRVGRADALIYGKGGKPAMIIECKAARVKITQDVFDQVARYNLSFALPFLTVTNGLEHYCCRMKEDKTGWVFLQDVPDFALLNESL